MAGVRSGLRTMTISPDSGQKQNKSGQAKKTKAEGETNSTSQYTIKSTVPGPHGGKNTNS